MPGTLLPTPGETGRALRWTVVDGETGRHPGAATAGEGRPGETSLELAGRLAFAWSVVVVLVGVAIVVVLPPFIRFVESGYCENGDHPGPCADVTGVVVSGFLTVAFGTWGIVAGRSARKGQAWARRALIVTFSLSAVGVVGTLATALLRSDDADALAIATFLLLLAYFVAIVTLARRARV
jgi:cytochrome bd-type quinol oxidase subunit 2